MAASTWLNTTSRSACQGPHVGPARSPGESKRPMAGLHGNRLYYPSFAGREIRLFANGSAGPTTPAVVIDVGPEGARVEFSASWLEIAAASPTLAAQSADDRRACALETLAPWSLSASDGHDRLFSRRVFPS